VKFWKSYSRSESTVPVRHHTQYHSHRSGVAEEWSDATWLYPKAVRFLEIPEYRGSILMGLVLSVGTKTESTVSILVCSSTILELKVTPA